MLPLILSQSLSAGVGEFLSLIWMELAMFMVAAFGYMLFHGEIPLIRTIKRAKKECGNEKTSELESAGQELQRRASAGDNLGAFKLWQRIKSMEVNPPSVPTEAADGTAGFPLSAVVMAMRALGKSVTEIVAEFRTACECNQGLFSVETLAALMDELRKDGLGSAPLIRELQTSGLLAPLDTPSATPRPSSSLRKANGSCEGVSPTTANSSCKSSQALLTSAIRRGHLEDALLHLELQVLRNDSEPAAQSLREPLAHVLTLAARQGRLLDTAVGLPKGVAAIISTATVNDLLLEAVRRRDGHLCRQVARLVAHLDIKKDEQTYQLLIRGLTSDAAAVQKLFEEAKSDSSFKMSESLGLTLLHACASNRDAKLAPRVFQELAPADGAPRDHVVLAALCKVYVACELHDKVCDVYEHEMMPKQLRPDAQFGDLLLKSAAIAGRAAISKTLFDGSTGDVGRHLTMIKLCRREGNLQGAIDVFEKLKESGTQLTPMIYNSLLDTCIYCNDMEKAQNLFQMMRAEGIVDVVSFNIVLKLYLQSHQHKKASDLLLEMTECGLVPNQITYNELVNAKVVAGDRGGAWELVQEMKSRGVRPSSVTCSIVLKSLTSKTPLEEFDRTMVLVDEMEERMDEVLFSCVIEACIRVGRLETLSMQMRRYARQGGLVSLSAQTYGSMIKAYGQAHNVERIWELWNEMEQRQVKLTAITLGCMVDALVTNKCAEEAWNLVCRLLNEPGRAELVNNIIYCTVLKGFSLTKQNEHLFAVYAEMRERGTAANTVTYNTLIDACARSGSMHRVPGLLSDMKSQGVLPDRITYSTLVKGHCFSGDLDSAFNVLSEMRQDGRHMPDDILYNSLLDGCSKEHRLDEALALFEVMREEGVPPSNFTLCTLIKLLGRARQLPRAFAIMKELCCEGGLKPNIQVFTCLVQACFHNRQLARALQLHDEILTSGCEPDQKTYNVLLRGCLRAGNLLKAVEVVRCSYLLAEHSFATTPSRAHGVEMKILEELIVRLNQGSRRDVVVAQTLIADLKRERSLNLQDNVYSQVVQRAARET